jgi:hypothetical protein
VTDGEKLGDALRLKDFVAEDETEGDLIGEKLTEPLGDSEGVAEGWTGLGVTEADGEIRSAKTCC